MDDMRLALILNAISPPIGGVLVRGEKGTAKSTTIRALTSVLPPVDVVADCRFSCSPAAPDPGCPDGPHHDGDAVLRRAARLVELPVGATDDRLTGSLDVGRALTEGVTSFQPGLLAQAHRGVLYVDEVNLLSDHLVDLLLDAAAMGTNYVERDAVSIRHAATFLLVGTMNPEEGELRPQLLDRFGLTVEVTAPRDPAVRAEIVRRRMDFDASPAGFAARYAPDDAALADAIERARTVLPQVVIEDADLERIASVCAAFDVDGLRADIVIARAAAAHAAWEQRCSITREDIRVAARLALPHRRRRNPFDAPGIDEDALDEALGPDEPDDPGPEDSGPGPGDTPTDGPEGDTASGGPDAAGSPNPETAADGGSEQTPGPSASTAPQQAAGDAAGQQPAAVSVVGTGATFRARRLEVPGKGSGASGRRSRALTDSGRTIGSRQPTGPVRDIHPVATLIASAPHQLARGRSGPGLALTRSDLRERRREGRESNLVLFAVDASGSMAARQRMGSVKGAVLSLLLDAYQRRDKVGLIAFRGSAAELLLPPTSSVDAAAARLETMPTGGRTPLAAGLAEAHVVVQRERLRDPLRRPLVIVVTDGRYTFGPHPAGAATLLAKAGTACVVVDCESGPIRLGMAQELAGALGGPCLRPDELSAGALAGAARGFRDAA